MNEQNSQLMQRSN